MGNAHAELTNNTLFPVCVVTFNYSDMLYLQYNNFYTINPGKTATLEALTNPFGLKYAIVYDADAEGMFSIKLWSISNGGKVSIDSIQGFKILSIGSDHDEISSFGIKYLYWSDFLEVIDSLRRANLNVPDIAQMQNIPSSAVQQRSSRRGAPQEPIADLTSVIRNQRSNLRPPSVFEPSLPYQVAGTEQLDAAQRLEDGDDELDTGFDSNSPEESTRRKTISYVPASLPSNSVHVVAPLTARRGSESVVKPNSGRSSFKKMVGPRRSVSSRSSTSSENYADFQSVTETR